MDIKDIRQLVKLMVESGLTELDIVEGENKIAMKRGSGNVPIVSTQFAAQAPAAPAAPVAQAPSAHAAAPAAGSAKPVENLLEIKSPMVGTFYAAPSPDSDAFVSVGSAISDETPVCIIEAMKVMNEIKAECAGIIAEVCVKNAQPVEFGQVLFRVRPA